MSIDRKNLRSLITGGNSGIGKATSMALAEKGHRLVLAVRDIAKGEEAAEEIRANCAKKDIIADITVMKLDLASLYSVRDFAEEYQRQFGRLDVLINNAGVMLDDHGKTIDGIEETFGINHLGHFYLTKLLLPIIKASAPSRIITVSSAVHHLVVAAPRNADAWQSEGFYTGFGAYAKSKLANILFTKELSKRLCDDDIAVNCLHPGIIRTRLGKDGDLSGVNDWMMRAAGFIMKTPRQGAKTSVKLASEMNISENDTKISGFYFNNGRIKTPSRLARSESLALRLWQISENLVNDIMGEDCPLNECNETKIEEITEIKEKKAC